MLVSTAAGTPAGKDIPGYGNGFALALGCFDGVHLGHAALFDALRSKAGDLVCAAWTFAPPKSGKNCPVKGNPLIVSYEEKLSLLNSVGIKYAFVYEFSEISHLPPEQFVSDIRIGDCGCRFAVCGYNFTFGAKAAGNAEMLRSLLDKYSVFTEIVGEVTVGGGRVCSADIRAALLRGDMP